MNVQPFSPQLTSVTVSVTTSNSSTALPMQGVPAAVARIVNAGAGIVFFNFSKGSGTATVAASTPMLANTVEVFSKSLDADTINIIGSAAATVYVTCGEGQ